MSQLVAALLWGGIGREAEVSRQSANQVADALGQLEYSCVEIEVTAGLGWIERLVDIDVAVNMVHGSQGEDGTLVGILASSGIPYTGSGVKGSALCFDKIMTRLLWQSMGGRVAAAEWLDLSNYTQVARTALAQQRPLIMKPVAEGSSFDLKLIEGTESLLSTMENLLSRSDRIMIEEYLPGREFTLGYLDDTMLGAIEIRPQGALYDYDAKYNDDRTGFATPGAEIEQCLPVLKNLCQRFIRIVGIEGAARFDFRMSGKAAYLLEVNTVPGMTSHSLLPMTARQYGWSFVELVDQILAGARSKP